MQCLHLMKGATMSARRENNREGSIIHMLCAPLNLSPALISGLSIGWYAKEIGFGFFPVFKDVRFPPSFSGLFF
ncbi:hypothetical protein BDV32DRAFT_24216 [Aspergillus pseudonomiae]|nr:hypothetical protein BDV32DRAFT_24216 [Aspergillus pseudonomiae]